MESAKVEFTNKEGHLLSGRLELPSQVKAFAIYAHCFTCTKNITAAYAISKTLASLGIATLRFDFTGLGDSAGDFKITSVSTNISDILSAHAFLSKDFEKPTLLIGHSLGGLAALHASKLMPSLKGLVMLNAPSTTEHTIKRFVEPLEKVLHQGYGDLDILGKRYAVHKDFIEDAKNFFTLDLSRLQATLLVMHSEQDDIVPFHHGQHIFETATVSKSLISLKHMDHLLKDRNHCEQAAHIIHSWFNTL